MNLKELYNSNKDIKESDIPEKWKHSFFQFIIGQACYSETDINGNFLQFIYYSGDFRRWYNMNKIAIERDIKIDDLIDDN